MFFAVGICLATIVTVLVIYFGARLVLKSETEGETKDLAGSILFRIAALHGLVLALVFASVVVEYQQLGLESATEANAISDVYYDAGRYDSEGTLKVHQTIRSYLKIAAVDEWSLLATDQVLDSRAWSAWDDLYSSVLDLEPENVRQEALRDNMLTKVHLIGESRDLREHHAKNSQSALFWTAALLGVVLISVGYFIYPPNRNNLILLSMFGAYTGFILFTIFAMTNPFAAPAALEPTQFVDLLAELERGS